ncbi:hypothetical protein AB0436_20215 [Streptomyces sp. NPDC051322]|uniref:hypothetical protein n=1 Tax=Streptomyces sp. NPDC051322 TaxID=3154645 RepID=UPI00344B061B
MTRRWSLLTLALVLASAAGACGDSTASSGDGKQKAVQARRTVAEEYWRVHNSLDGTVERSDGSGAFAKRPKDAKNSVAYTIEDEIDASDRKETRNHLEAKLEAVLSRRDWKLQSQGSNSGVDFYTAQRDGMHMTVKLQERAKDVPAGGFLAVRGECANIGQAQKEMIRDYAGSLRDMYRSDSASSSPVPTGFPNPDKL